MSQRRGIQSVTVRFTDGTMIDVFQPTLGCYREVVTGPNDPSGKGRKDYMVHEVTWTSAIAREVGNGGTK